MKGKQANFLKYKINVNIASMIRQVYKSLKVDSKNGDLVSIV